MGLNVTGNLLNWIKNFLTNRSYQVKIGDSFSNSFTSENGTPQGSALSPLLFLVMINDFPTLSKFTSDAFFADDCSIWRSGTNLQQILFHLQQDLNLIESWCNKWGFVINAEKTTGIVFTKKNLALGNIQLKIQGKNINFMDSCKLLGVIFDRRMTWSPHVDYWLQNVNVLST